MTIQMHYIVHVLYTCTPIKTPVNATTSVDLMYVTGVQHTYVPVVDDSDKHEDGEDRCVVVGYEPGEKDQGERHQQERHDRDGEYQLVL